MGTDTLRLFDKVASNPWSLVYYYNLRRGPKQH